MANFEGNIFCLICSHLRGLEERWVTDRDQVVSDADLEQIVLDLMFIGEKCTGAGLVNAAAYISDNLAMIKGKTTFDFVARTFGNLSFQIRSEMKRTKFLTVDRPQFYGDSPLFPDFITDIYPELTYDIVEAGNCLALNRTTASVFHLMRIMEFGVRQLGRKFNVSLVNEPVWQVIMDQVNSRIKAMPDKPAPKKRIKEQYADVAGHLHNVKVAWRNPVMHPKRTYTPEEAENLFGAVRAFMKVLVGVIKPKMVAHLKANVLTKEDKETLDILFGSKKSDGTPE